LPAQKLSEKTRERHIDDEKAFSILQLFFSAADVSSVRKK
jgi:hypothetical protein